MPRTLIGVYGQRDPAREARRDLSYECVMIPPPPFTIKSFIFDGPAAFWATDGRAWYHEPYGPKVVAAVDWSPPEIRVGAKFYDSFPQAEEYTILGTLFD